MSTADPFLTAVEVAEELRCSDQTVYRIAARGDLRALKDGRGMFRVRRSWLDAYIEAKSTPAARRIRRAS